MSPAEQLQKKITYRFIATSLLEQALTHRSFAFESKPSLPHNERLELLGDAVLGLIVTHILMQRFPNHQEGELSKARSAIVSEGALNKMAVELDLSCALRLGKGELNSGGAKKPRLLSSAFEALVGAIYLDGGLPAAENFVAPRIEQILDGVQEPGEMILDYKTRLQELIQDKHRSLPKYLVIREEGPPHQKQFEVQVFVDSKMMGWGSGRTKKEAEQMAALDAWNALTKESVS